MSKAIDPTARLDVALMRIAARTIQPRLTQGEWANIAPLMEETAQQLQAIIMQPKVRRTLQDLRAALQIADQARRDQEHPQ